MKRLAVVADRVLDEVVNVPVWLMFHAVGVHQPFHLPKPPQSRTRPAG